MDGFRRRFFSGRENALHHYALEPVFPVTDIAGIVAHADGKDGQRTLGREVFLAGFGGQHSIEIAFTISGLVVVRPLVPGKNPYLIEVYRAAIFGFVGSSPVGPPSPCRTKGRSHGSC